MLHHQDEFILLSTQISDLKNYSPSMFVSICFLEIKDKILLLKTDAPHKPQNNKWSAAGGKIENGETALMAVQRELFEETSVLLATNNFKYITKVFMRNPQIDYEMSIYRAPIETINEQNINIKLNPKEHSIFAWDTPHNALTYDLMHGAKEIIQFVYNVS